MTFFILLLYLSVMCSWAIIFLFNFPSLPKRLSRLGNKVAFRSYFLTYVSCSLGQSSLFAIILPYLGVMLAWAIMSLSILRAYLGACLFGQSCLFSILLPNLGVIIAWAIMSISILFPYLSIISLVRSCLL